MKTFAKKIHSLKKKYGRRNTEALLGYLVGTLGKQYDNEEELECLIENCEEWEKDPTCFN